MDKIGQPIRGVDTDADLTRADHSIGAPIGERRNKSGRGLDKAVMRLVDEGKKRGGDVRACMHIPFFPYMRGTARPFLGEEGLRSG